MIFMRQNKKKSLSLKNGSDNVTLDKYVLAASRSKSDAFERNEHSGGQPGNTSTPASATGQRRRRAG